jgi:uncharacterized membrane protein YhaH (DUF805 family)
MIERNSEINFKRLRFWIFVGAFSICVVVIGVVKNIIIYFRS